MDCCCRDELVRECVGTSEKWYQGWEGLTLAYSTPQEITKLQSAYRQYCTYGWWHLCMVWLRTLLVAGYVTAFVLNSPRLNTEAVRSFAEWDSSKPVVKTARNMRKSKSGVQQHANELEQHHVGAPYLPLAKLSNLQTFWSGQRSKKVCHRCQWQHIISAVGD